VLIHHGFIAGGTIRRRSLVEEIGHWGVVSKGISCPWTLPLFLSLLLGHHVVGSFPQNFFKMFLLWHRSKSNGAGQPWTEIIRQSKSLLPYAVYPRYFTTAMKN
jgi:hypothetical protein